MVSLSLPNVGGDKPFSQKLKEQNPDIVPIDLVCITDGAVVECLDEGPHPVMGGKAFPAWQSVSPTPSRQRILAMLRKRDGAGNPVWYATKPGVRVWDKDINRYVDAPVITAEMKPLQDAHAAIRDDRARAGRALMEKKKAEAAEQQAATEQTVINALGKLLGKAESSTKAAPSKKEGA